MKFPIDSIDMSSELVFYARYNIVSLRFSCRYVMLSQSFAEYACTGLMVFVDCWISFGETLRQLDLKSRNCWDGISIGLITCFLFVFLFQTSPLWRGLDIIRSLIIASWRFHIIKFGTIRWPASLMYDILIQDITGRYFIAYMICNAILLAQRIFIRLNKLMLAVLKKQSFVHLNNALLGNNLNECAVESYADGQWQQGFTTLIRLVMVLSLSSLFIANFSLAYVLALSSTIAKTICNCT